MPWCMSIQYIDITMTSYIRDTILPELSIFSAANNVGKL